MAMALVMALAMALALALALAMAMALANMNKNNPAKQALIAFSVSLVGLFAIAGCMKKKEPKELIKKEIADMVREAEEKMKEKSHTARVVRHEKHERVGNERR